MRIHVGLVLNAKATVGMSDSGAVCERKHMKKGENRGL